VFGHQVEAQAVGGFIAPPAGGAPDANLIRIAEPVADASMDAGECIGSCTNHGECEAACPKNISIDFIALMHKDYREAKLKNRKLIAQV